MWLETLHIDILRLIAANIDIDQLLLLYNISSVFAKFSQTNLKSLLIERIPNHYQISNMNQLIKLAKLLQQYPYYDNINDIGFGDISVSNNQKYPMNCNMVDLLHQSKKLGIVCYPMETSKFVNRPLLQENYIKVKLDLHNSLDIKFINILDRIYCLAAKFIDNNKEPLGVSKFSVDTPDRSGFTRPIFDNTDNAGNIIPGYRPSVYLGLSQDNTCKFQNYEVKFIPVIEIKLMVSAGRCYLNIEIVNVIIIDTIPINSISKQINTLAILNGKVVQETPINYTTYLKCDQHRIRYKYYHSFNAIRLKYDYECDPWISDFELEGCEMISDEGICHWKVDHKHDIGVKIDNQAFIKKIDDIYDEISQDINTNNHAFRMFYFDVINPKSTFVYPFDICDSIAYTRFHILDSARIKTLFIDRHNNQIDWTLLISKRIKLIPLLCIKRIIIRGMCEFEIYIKSAVVTEY